MATTRNKSTTAHLCLCRNSNSSLMSPSPSPPQSPSAFASSTAASFTSRSCSSTASFLSRATSPTRVNMYNRQKNNSQSLPSVSLSIDRSTSPSQSSLSMIRRQATPPASAMTSQKRSCSCSPTTHPGSFRCAFHKALMRNSRKDNRSSSSDGVTQSASYHSSSRLNFRRSAMTNSLVRIGGVEGELVKRALSALIRPSSHHQRRRSSFEPKPSRLSVMSKAEEEVES